MAYPATVSRWCGMLAPAVLIGGVAAAGTLDPQFAWTVGSLPALRAPDAAYTWLFQVAMIVAGLLVAAAAWRLWRERDWVLGRTTVLLVVPAGLAVAGVGGLPHDHAFYLSNALGAVFLAQLVVALDATEAVIAGHARRALAGLWTVTVHAVLWGLWLANLLPATGTAFPALLAAAVTGSWLFWTVDGTARHPLTERLQAAAADVVGRVR